MRGSSFFGGRLRAATLVAKSDAPAVGNDAQVPEQEVGTDTPIVVVDAGADAAKDALAA